jgi:hypothetical protein
MKEFILRILANGKIFVRNILIANGFEINTTAFYQLMNNYVHEGLIEGFKVEKVIGDQITHEMWFRRKV